MLHVTCYMSHVTCLLQCKRSKDVASTLESFSYHFPIKQWAFDRGGSVRAGTSPAWAFVLPSNRLTPTPALLSR